MVSLHYPSRPVGFSEIEVFILELLLDSCGLLFSSLYIWELVASWMHHSRRRCQIIHIYENSSWMALLWGMLLSLRTINIFFVVVFIVIVNFWYAGILYCLKIFWHFSVPLPLLYTSELWDNYHLPALKAKKKIFL